MSLWCATIRTRPAAIMQKMGIVECETPVSDPSTGHTMVILPNPATDWISVIVASDQHSISGTGDCGSVSVRWPAGQGSDHT
jgi:hypothetical protein